MIRPIEVEAREGFRIWLRYSDVASGEVDLSHLAEDAACSRRGTSRGTLTRCI